MLKWSNYLIILAFAFCFFGCNNNDSSSSNSENLSSGLFEYLDPAETGVNFINEVVDQEDFNVLTYRNFYNGGGVGIGDFNNDGLNDIYLTANLKANKLYINKGDIKFDNISATAGATGRGGWSTGVSLVDINADGFLDIYVANSGDVKGESRHNELFINNGDLTFTDQAQAYNLDNNGYSTHAAFFDYDGDGDLDCYILNNSFKDPSRIDLYDKTREEDDALGGDRLMRNDGGVFVDVSKDAGIYTSAIGFGLGVSIGDVNNDFWPDIYISNDFWERDYLYINNQDGTFTEDLANQVSICSISSMGADIGDINNDGYQDIFTTDMLAADNFRLKSATIFDPYHLEDLKFRASYHYQILQNCLQVNRGGKGFREVASLSGISATDWSWGALMFDFDNDSNKDIYVCNGIYHDIMSLDFANFLDDKEEIKKIVTEKGRYDFRDFLQFLPTKAIDNYAFVNKGNLKFESEAASLGFKTGEYSNGAAYGDLDNDGDYELVINNINAIASIYENHSEKNGNHYLALRLKGSPSNPDAIGARIEVQIDDQIINQELYRNRGFQSSVPSHITMGLGKAHSIDQLVIIWPDKTTQIVHNPKLDTILTITKEQALLPAIVQDKPSALFTDITSIIKGDHSHNEDIYNDFDREPLLLRMHSTEGPKIVVADVNGDGLEDFLTLGATNDSDKLFLQSKSGGFVFAKNQLFKNDNKFESTCAAFFDADNDGDQDLLIGSGGNQLSKGIDGFKLRYYENDGKGQFIRIDFKAPQGAGQVSVIAPCDFDKDGDIDLFVGGRSVPGNYGLAPRSFLFTNGGDGTWTDISTRSLGTVGMVTDATWSDMDMDGDQDLLLVGEWMPVTYFINDKNTFENKKAIPNSSGWWLDIEATDLNGDGKDEFVLGNWGENSKFKASVENPLTMYLKDFDNNGKTEFILNWYPPLDDQAYPFVSKDDLTKQLPHLKKRILKYEEYATKDYNSLFNETERSGATKFICQTLSTSILALHETGPQLITLPVEAQIAPSFAITSHDFNNDGLKDIWLGGNFHGLKPEAGHLDASKGVLLLNKRNLLFEEALNNPDITRGEVRDALMIQIGDKEKALFIARNNKPIQVLSFK